MVVHFSLRRVTAVRVRTENLCHLLESPVEVPGMFCHVALQKTHATMINPIGYPIAGDAGLLFPMHQNLLPPEAQQSIPTTSPHTSCSSHERPRSPFSIPIISTMMPGGWVASAVVPVSTMVNFLDIVLVSNTTQVPLLGGSNSKVGIAGKVLSRWSHLAHLIEAKL